MFDNDESDSNWAVTLTFVIAAVLLVPFGAILFVYVAFALMFVLFE